MIPQNDSDATHPGENPFYAPFPSRRESYFR